MREKESEEGGDGAGKRQTPRLLHPPRQKSEIAGCSADLSGGGSVCTVETRITVRFRTPKSPPQLDKAKHSRSLCEDGHLWVCWMTAHSYNFHQWLYGSDYLIRGVMAAARLRPALPVSRDKSSGRPLQSCDNAAAKAFPPAYIKHWG